jgi:hypothetical protein
MSQDDRKEEKLIDRRFARSLVFEYGVLDDGNIWVALPDRHIFRIDKLTLNVMLDLNAGKTVKECSDKYAIDLNHIETLLRTVAGHSGLVPENSGRISRFAVRPDSDVSGYLIAFFAMLALQAYYFLFRSHTVLMGKLSEGVIVAAAAVAAVIFHEAGHFLATWKYTGIKPKAGFEMNFVFPTVYVDTHEAWKLPKNERLVINTAGMFLDLAVNTIAVAAALALPAAEYYVTPFLITQYMRWSVLLNPVFKGDGYWLLSDIFGLANMEKKGIEELKKLKFSPLSAFGLISIAFSIISFIGFVWFILSLAGAAFRAVLARLVFK